MRRTTTATLVVLAALLASAQISWASDAVTSSDAETHSLDPLVLAGVAVILVIAKVAGEAFERFKQPAVLGELVGGVLIGNLTLVGLHTAGALKSNEIIGALAEIGVIILLFEVGLESNVADMLEVGWSSLFVAVAGVVAPFFLGWGVAAYLLPDESGLAHIFVGATLCATSVGITARVLKDLNKLQTREARIVLGAAVIDDVLGLLILAVVSGAIRAASLGQQLVVTDVVIIGAKALVFLIGAIAVGHYVVPHLFHGAGRFETRGVLLAVSISFCFALAWLAAQVGLAPIVGAFAAGLVLDEAHFEPFSKRGEPGLEQLISPVSAMLAPIFFVVMGLRVDLNVFRRPEVLGLAAALTIAAVVGKQVCGLAPTQRGLNRLAIGVGMIPRGEVGLIFAAIGATLALPDAQGRPIPVIGSATFAAVVIMVIATTLLTPPVLKWAMSKGDGSPDRQVSPSD